MAAGFVFGCVIFLLIHSCHGLYEDQINKYDWKKQYIGKIKQVVYDGSMSVSKNLFVATERNAIASLSSKSGQLNWRQLLLDNVIKILHSSDGVISISSGGIARMWEAGTGLVKWEANLASEVADEAKVFELLDVAILDTSYTEGNLIVILSSAGLFTIQNAAPTSSRAKAKVRFAAIQNVQDGSKVYVNSETKQIIVLNMNEGLTISATFFNPKTLEVENARTMQTAWLDNVKNTLLLEDNRLLYISKEMGAIYVLDVQAGKGISQQTLSSLQIGSSVRSLHVAEDRDTNYIGEDFHIITEDGEVIHFRINDQNIISVIGRINPSDDSEVKNVDVIKVGSEQYYFVTKVKGRNLIVNGYDQTTGKEDGSLVMEFTLPEDVGSIESVFINMHLKRTSPVGYRVLVTTSDDCALMVTLPTRLAWRRDEALANVVTAEMLDLPLSDIEAGIEVEFEQAEKLSIVGMFVNRVQAQVGQVRSFAKHLTKGIKEGTLLEKKTNDPLIQDESLTRDPFSLHKMLVLVTKCGKIFGMDSLSGEIIWRLNAISMANKNLKLFIQRTTAHFPHPPLALLLSEDEESTVTSILTFNPITGEEFGDGSRKISDIVQVMMLPFPNSEYLKPLLLLDKDLKVHLLPDSQDVKEKLESVRKSIYMFNVDKKAGKIVGYWLQKGLKMIETYVIKIPDDQEVILVQGKEPHEKIDAMGRPLADRSVIYKYLNPNLVLVITQAKDASEASSTINMYLVDGVSGHIVYYATHKKASGPVHAVHSENWLLYSYWNTKARRTEIASYELYEGKQLRNTSTFSSFDDLHGVPTVFSQAYILSGIVTAMGVSKTEKALTTRQILFGLGRGGVLGLPRRFFDPRRPLTPEQSDREEGLIPYNPEIVVVPPLLLTYNKTVQAIKHIYSSPSALESTSIVLVTGLDMFFTRTTPSKMFDVLKEDFEYMLIVAVLSAMFIAAMVTRKMAQNKKLKKAWR